MTKFQKQLAVIGVVVLLIAGLVLEEFLLAGEVVFQESFQHLDFYQARVDITDPSARHTITIYTKEPVALAYSAKDPMMKILYREKELFPHMGKRTFDFTPKKKGKHLITVHPDLQLGLKKKATVEMRIGDRRWLPRLLGNWKSKF